MNIEIIPAKKLSTSERWDAAYFMKADSLESKFETVPLSQVLVERKEVIEPQKFKTHLFNYIGLENISSNTRVLVNFSPKQGLDIKSRSRIFRQGDILYGRMRPTLNKVLKIDETLIEGICSTEIFVLSPKLDLIDSDYLQELLSSDWIQSKVKWRVGGTTMPRINIRDFLSIEIPFPPLTIQQEIGRFVRSQRTEWHKHAELSTAMPDLIRGTVEEFLKSEKALMLKHTTHTASAWHNPLPKLELN